MTMAALVFAAAMAQAGPSERQVVDAAAAQRGRAVYAQHCINCHGSTAKGGPNGPDLIRSPAVLRDRLGAGMAAAMKRAAVHRAELTDAQVRDLSHFLHQRVEAIVRNRTATAPINVLTGDPEAGRAYFNGAGQCRTCHSPSGDLAGIATRIPEPVTLQQRVLFPSLNPKGKQVEVTVRTGSGPPVSGTLVRLDNFSVLLQDASGMPQSFTRGPGVSVEVRDPLAMHHTLLDRYTDADIHNVVAYLATIK